jgi:hypothetical protein
MFSASPPKPPSKHRRASIDGARERDTAPLPAGKHVPARPNLGVVPIRQRPDQALGASQIGRVNDLRRVRRRLGLEAGNIFG